MYRKNQIKYYVKDESGNKLFFFLNEDANKKILNEINGVRRIINEVNNKKIPSKKKKKKK